MGVEAGDGATHKEYVAACKAMDVETELQHDMCKRGTLAHDLFVKESDNADLLHGGC